MQNKTQSQAVQQLRSSGASGKHQDKREKRVRTRAAKKQSVLDEQDLHQD